ncbi:winged helix-turn-helix transcriptional regulator [Sphingomonas sp.]|uniref:winged helix-turn-helix transcriptional regulator n=1 Tax=Sphingomonas sp. TaxID=28214 RepID=UPI0035BBD54E
MKLEKTTEPTRRRYDDACGTALALDLVGERWSLLIVRELMFGPRRFGEVRANVPGVSANLLTQRLEGLEAAGIVRRRRLPSPANVQVYELTEWGLESEPIFEAMVRWALRSPAHDPSLFLSPASLMMSLRALFDPARAGGWTARIGFRSSGDVFVGTIADREFRARREDPAAADAVFSGEPGKLIGVIYGNRPIANAEAAGVLSVTGNRAAAERFVTLFPFPAKVSG